MPRELPLKAHYSCMKFVLKTSIIIVVAVVKGLRWGQKCLFPVFSY